MNPDSIKSATIKLDANALEEMKANKAKLYCYRLDLELDGLTEQFKIEHDKHNLCIVKFKDIDFSFRTVIVPMALGFEPSRYTAAVECSAYIGDGSSRKFMARSCGSDLKELFRKVTQEALDVSIHDLQNAYGTTQGFRDIKTTTTGQK